MIDVRGRILLFLEMRSGQTRWDLIDSQGNPVGSGAYWLRLRGESESSAATRVTVFR